MSRKQRGSISRALASTVDKGEAEQLLTSAMATSEILSGYTKEEVCTERDYCWSTHRPRAVKP